ncbi:MAG: sodium:proton antiporter [Rhodobacterales bacterium]|nr:MAG: sodium:proton antiporter [Rhodobacterales bacterium]
MYKVRNFINEYSILLIVGAVVALFWANTDPHSYHHFVEFPLWFNSWIGVDIYSWTSSYGEAAHHYEIGDVEKVVTFHYLVNDLLMALFFAIAAKEVWEAVALKNGSLRGRKAASPLIATAGGMVGPVAVYLGLAMFMGSDIFDAVAHGWAVPTATDIAFSYLVGRIVFGAGHPAVRFLLLLAIADDAGGLIILAIFYPTATLAPVWLLLSVGVAVLVYLLFNYLPRYMDRGNQLRPLSTWVRKYLGPWPYVVAGAISWFGFAQSGIHPALGLLPIVPAIPHADRAFGIFADAERHLKDLLNEMEHALQVPVDLVLLMFGLANAGVEFSAIGEPTWLVLAGLLIGKPLGIFLFGWLAAKPLGLGLPQGMRIVDLIVVGTVAAIGFTVALFVAAVAFEPGPVQDAAKMGALFSFGAGIVSVIVGRLLGVERQKG